MRTMFMRYISHEMRTPLNTVFLGLNILLKQFQILNLETDHICCQTIKDVQSSCEIALDVLNDMLLYDKIDTGLLSLELIYASPWMVVKHSVEPYFIQVRTYLFI